MDGSSATSRSNLQLTLGTISFAICFAAWGLISAFAPRFRETFHLTATQTAFLVAVPVLLGALLRIVTGMLADRFGGRVVFSLLLIVVAVPAYLVPMVLSYRMLLYVAFFLGMAGTGPCGGGGLAEYFSRYGGVTDRLGSCFLFTGAQLAKNSPAGRHWRDVPTTLTRTIVLGIVPVLFLNVRRIRSVFHLLAGPAQRPVRTKGG